MGICWIGGLACKGVLNSLIQRISKITKYGIILSFLFSGLGVVGSLGLWFVPKLSGVKYTEDINWSTLYLITTVLDFAILQQIIGFIRYMATFSYLSGSKSVSFISRFLKSDYFLSKMK